MRTECWIKGDLVVIANVMENGQVIVGCYTYNDYGSFVAEISRYGYVKGGENET